MAFLVGHSFFSNFEWVGVV